MRWAALRHAAGLAAAIMLAALAGCGGPDTRWGEGHYKLGRPYQINGRWYYPAYDPDYEQVGVASWYGAAFHGLETANGEVFDKDELSAAHPTLPLPSIVRVTNLANGRSLDLRVNDRGPFVGGRMIDLSQAAARRLGFERAGLTPVQVKFLRLADARGTPPRPQAQAVRVARRTPEPPPRSAPPTRPRPVVLAEAAPASPPSRPRRARAAGWTAAPAPASCAAGPHYIQVGAFADSVRVQAATAALHGLDRVTVEPYFAGGTALARVRLGPLPDDATAIAMLDRVRGLGYPEAFVVPASGPTSTGSC